MPIFPGYSAYNGATITRVVDKSGAEYIGACTKDGAGVFGFRVFRNGVNVPLAPFCSGRGSINADGHWIAWEGAAYFTGIIPGFVPRMPTLIPLNGAIDSLYDGVYTPQDFDTPAEIAVRVQKLLDALQELIALQKQAGVLT